MSFDEYLARYLARYPSDAHPPRRDYRQILGRGRPYLIPGTTVLRNNFGIDEPAALSDLEFVATADRMVAWHRRLAEGAIRTNDVAPSTGVCSATFMLSSVFAGRVLRNTQQARDMLANPLLQIFPGRAMTCVFDQAKALCQTRRAQGDRRVTPDQDDCRPNCRNIAYTDRDIDQLRVKVAGIRDIVDDSLAPSPRHHRACAESERLQRIIDNHDCHRQAP